MHEISACQYNAIQFTTYFFQCRNHTQLAFNLISVLIKHLSLWQGDCCA